MGSLMSSAGQYGMIFIESVFEKLTIEVDEPDEHGGYSWSGKNGWMISAPCSNRIEAIKISNELIQKLNKDLFVR